ncbi:MAG: hypothetical protein KGS61_20565 [Verrucomicrobia bacterium]|nr:hypothetical protein [Verrucomicrobiota bacterium]
MSTILEIERAIERLAPGERAKLGVWFAEREAKDWDAQVDADAAAGKLDFLFREADAEREAGDLTSWPPNG